MMTSHDLICAVLIFMQISWSQCFTSAAAPNPQSESQPEAVGAYAYQDSHGHRYEGTYQLKDGKVEYSSGGPLPFKTVLDPVIPKDGPLPVPHQFFPTFLTNFENFIQEYFPYNFEEQRLAVDAAQKAFDLTLNGATSTKFPSLMSYENPINSNTDYALSSYADNSNPISFNNFAMPNNNFGIPNFGFFNNLNDLSGASNRAFASAMAGPDFVRQMAGISPMNLQEPNIDTSMPSVGPRNGEPQFKSVYSSSFAKSTNVNGEMKTERGAETVVNDNGKVTKYKVHS